MSATRHHLEFAPPPTPGMVRGVLLALVAHLLLVAVLTVGVAWKRETPPVAVEAELWAAVPQEAAPPPPPEPEPEPPVPEEPPLPVRPAPPPAPPVADAPKAADIAIAKEKEKEKARLQKEKELQQAKLEQERKAQQDKLQREKLAQEKQRKEQDAKLARDKAEKAEKADKAKADALAKQKASKAAEVAAQKSRDEQLKRMAALAGGPTGSGGSGTAAKSAGLSSNYSGRIAASIKRGMVYTKMVVGNPRVEVEISASANGAIQSRRVSKPSGNPAWDDAVLDAIDKLERLPLDESGRVPSPMTISYSADDMIGR